MKRKVSTRFAADANEPIQSRASFHLDDATLAWSSSIPHCCLPVKCGLSSRDQLVLAGQLKAGARHLVRRSASSQETIALRLEVSLSHWVPPRSRQHLRDLSDLAADIHDGQMAFGLLTTSENLLHTCFLLA